MEFDNLTNAEFDFINSASCDHLTFEEKLSLLEKYSWLKDSFDKHKIVIPFENKTNYHKILKAHAKNKILVVGGEGKSIYTNVKTLNFCPNSNPDIIADIDKNLLPDKSFDIIFFECVGFSDSFYTMFNNTKSIDVTINSLMESHRLLKSNGRLIIITGNYFHNSIKYLLQVSGFWKKSYKLIIKSSDIHESDINIYCPLHFVKI